MDDITEVYKSKCWKCARAYALPDPNGCAFHRKDHERVFEKSHSFFIGTDEYVVVTECELFLPSTQRPALGWVKAMEGKEWWE